MDSKIRTDGDWVYKEYCERLEGNKFDKESLRKYFFYALHVLKHLGLITDQMKRGYVIVKNFFAKSNYFNMDQIQIMESNDPNNPF